MKSFAPLLALAAVACAQQKGKPTAAECAQANIVAMLIQANIADQQEEVKAVNAVGDALAKNDQAAFGEARNQLLDVVNNGIAIRQTAQQVSPNSLPAAAAAGLETVKNAQLGELMLAMNLTGNPATDSAIVDQLKKDFAGGIEQNKLNAAAAVEGCGAAAGAANGKANDKNNKNNGAVSGANKPAAGAEANKGAADAAKPAAGAEANKGAAAGAKPAAGAEANKETADAAKAKPAAGAEANKGAAKPAAGAEANKGAAAGAKPAAGAEANKGAADAAKAKPAAAQPAKEAEEEEEEEETKKRAVRHARDFGL